MILRVGTASFVFSSFRAFVTKSFAVGGGLGGLPEREPALGHSWLPFVFLSPGRGEFLCGFQKNVADSSTPGARHTIRRRQP